VRTLIFTLSIFSFTLNCFAQHVTIKQKPVNPQEALDNFYAQNYKKGLDQLLVLYKTDSLNIQYNQFIGVCYLNTYSNVPKAIPYFEFVIKQKKYDVYALYDLGLAYMHCHRFDDAIRSFERFMEERKGKEVNLISADREIEMCKNALELIKKPLNVKFENLGPVINSPFPEINPLINNDETMLIFSSRRQGNTGNMIDNDGYCTPDIYFSEIKNNNWEKAKKISGGINTPYTELSVGLSPNADILFLCIDDVNHKYKVLASPKKGKTFVRPESLGEALYANSNMTGACTSKDNKTLFFSSDKPGGRGGKDIYISKKLPSGEWSTPKNAGDMINTEYDEDYPIMSPDNETLYFASTGHNSMGGYDIFKSEWNKEDDTFSEPENIGYPLNDTYDNKLISFTRSGRYAYLVTNRNDGLGDLDVYRVVFNDVKFRECIFRGEILGKDTENIFSILRNRIYDLQLAIDTLGKSYDSLTKAFKPSKKSPVNNDTSYTKLGNILNHYKDEILGIKDSFYVYVVVTDKKNTQSNALIYRPNQFTAKFIVPFLPGEYTLKIEAKGYLPYSKELIIYDNESQPRLIEEDIHLQKKNN